MKKSKVEIEGMTCPRCEAHVKKELENIGAKKVNANHKEKAAIFEINDNISEDTIKRAVKTAGYAPEKVFFKKIEKKRLFGLLK